MQFFGTWWQRVQVGSTSARTTATPTSSTGSLRDARRRAEGIEEINLSEDVFAGYKTMLRGGRVVHVEYHQLGKGRMTTCRR